MSDKISVLIGEKEVDERIEEIGKQISKAYEGKCVHMICVLKGSVFFCLRTGKENYRSGDFGFYVRVQLWG